jgi:type II secretory ATPase GspE/PulE/Tfp pilus assembly ATPase PilB-like protein
MKDITAEAASRMKEAEVYQSMGLWEEALEIYQRLLSSGSFAEDDPLRLRIERGISYLKEEIFRRESSEVDDLSPHEITMIKQVVSSEGSVGEMVESAAALVELGLFDEAAAEYQKLVDRKSLPVEALPQVFRCFLKMLPTDAATSKMDRIASTMGLSTVDRADLNYRVGLELEKNGYKDRALHLFRQALSMNPLNAELKARVESMIGPGAAGSRYDYLKAEKIITSDQLQAALAVSKRSRKSVEYALIEMFGVTKKDIGRSLSLYYGCRFRDFDDSFPVPVELIRSLKKSFLLHDMWVPLSWGSGGVEILVDDPKDLRKTDQIGGLIKTKKLVLSVGIREDIEKFIHYFFEQKRTDAIQQISEELDMIPEVSFEEEEEPEVKDIHDESSSQVVRLVDQVVVAAFRRDASDIHIEPSPVTRTTGIRFRQDGVCQEYLQVPNSMARGILSRVKIMAGLDIAERRLPQDGKIKFRRKGVPEFELRIATIPTAGGFEDAVLRILAKAGAMKLDAMGLNERNLEILVREISQPYGLILVVGPTGSGKTTTLHSALDYINRPGIKIWTAEDPVEITQAGLRQVEVKPKIGLDFARVMRAFLRADPDVIMIGEMRDYETASIGIEASLTGHLVLSTLHTNSAPATITRLLDMGLNALNFSDAFLCVLAQRLVRRLCNDCKEKYHPERAEFEEIVTDYGRDDFEAQEIARYSKDLFLYRPKGCEACSGSGYKGRIGIHELMDGTLAIKEMIKKQANMDELFGQAASEGMMTLKQDGIQKVFQGLTDISEIRRVCIN